MFCVIRRDITRFSTYRQQPTSFSNIDLSDLRCNVPRVQSLDSVTAPLRSVAAEQPRVEFPLRNGASASDLPSMSRNFLPSKKNISYDGLVGSWQFVEDMEDHYDLYNVLDYYKV